MLPRETTMAPHLLSHKRPRHILNTGSRPTNTSKAFAQDLFHFYFSLSLFTNMQISSTHAPHQPQDLFHVYFSQIYKYLQHMLELSQHENHKMQSLCLYVRLSLFLCLSLPCACLQGFGRRRRGGECRGDPSSAEPPVGHQPSTHPGATPGSTPGATLSATAGAATTHPGATSSS